MYIIILKYLKITGFDDNHNFETEPQLSKPTDYTRLYQTQLTLDQTILDTTDTIPHQTKLDQIRPDTTELGIV